MNELCDIAGVNAQRDAKGLSLIDFHEGMKNYGQLFTDGIHPNLEGERLMAGILYESFTGVTIEQVSDPDLARGRPVTASGDDGNPPMGVNDGDAATAWTVHPLGWVIVDLGSVQNVELFQTDFGGDRPKGILYKIALSSNTTDWETVVDRSVAPPDTASPVRFDKITPAEARYVSLDLIGTEYDNMGSIGVCDFRVRKHMGTIHPPLLYWRTVQVKPAYTKYEVRFLSPNDSSESAALYRSMSDTSAFQGVAGLQRVGLAAYSVFVTKSDLSKGVTHRYRALAFKDGKEVLSGTIRIHFGTTGIHETGPASTLPEEVRLYPNYPNPFNPDTRLSFELSKSARVWLQVFDIQGRLLRTLADGHAPAGRHNVTWNGTDTAGNPIPSGVYFGSLTAGSAVQSTKMLLIR